MVLGSALEMKLFAKKKMFIHFFFEKNKTICVYMLACLDKQDGDTMH